MSEVFPAVSRSLGLALLAALVLSPAQASADACPGERTITTAGAYECDVPAGAGAVFVAAAGGRGANSSDGSGQGGPGDFVSAWYLVGPGQPFTAGATVDVAVGDDGNGRTSSFGGGGSGGTGAQSNGGVGGGGSSVAVSGRSLLVAGGGGGGGGGNLNGWLSSNQVFGGGAGGGVGGGGAQGAGLPDALGNGGGSRVGGMGGGGAAGSPAEGGLAYVGFYATAVDGWPNGGWGGWNGTGGNGGGGGDALAGGGGGGGGALGGGGGGGGGDVVRQEREGDNYIDVRGETRSGAGGGGGGSDLVSGATLTVDQRQSTTGGSQVLMRFAPTTELFLRAPSAPMSSCDPVSFLVEGRFASDLQGSVTLTEGGRTIASAPLQPATPMSGGGMATFGVALSAGTHTIVANYAGDADSPPGGSAPVTQTVSACNGATTTALSSSDTSSSLCSPVTLTATVSGRAPTGPVTFLDGGTQIGQANVDANGNAALTISTLAAGSHPIVASYGGDASIGGDPKNEPSSSSPLDQVVEPDATGTQCTFAFAAGAVASVPVPTDASSMTVTALGGEGAGAVAWRGPGSGSPGGRGQVVTATIPVGGSGPVPAGATLAIAVGANGSGSPATPGGGGAGGRDSRLPGGAGGGASRISVGQSAVLVAAGGGGAGSGSPAMELGGMGGAAGEDAMPAFEDGSGSGGGGATAAAAGLAPSQRAGYFDMEPWGQQGTAGSLGQGGAGGMPYTGGGGGGGGGGGYYGGGGGDPGQDDGGGGGGGSGFVTPAASAQTVSVNYDAVPTMTIQFVAPVAATRAVARTAAARPASHKGPAITDVRRSARCMTVAGTKDARPHALRIGYRLSQRATMTFRLRRSFSARIRTHCKPVESAKGRWSRGSVRRSTTSAGRHRHDVLREHGTLRPGSYQLEMVATDIHGKRSATRRLRFAVIQ